MQILQESTCVAVFFNKIAGLQNCNFVNFSVKFAKFLRSPFSIFYKTSPVTTSDSFRFPAGTLSKKRHRQGCFSVNFAKFLRTSLDRTPLGECFLCLSVNFEKFSEHLFYRALLGNYLFNVQVAEFQRPDTVKNYFAGAFQAIHTRTRTSHSKEFIH